VKTKTNPPLIAGDRTTNLRYSKTVAFLEQSITPPARILDLGPPNRLGEILSRHGFNVMNTKGDLDLQPELGSVVADAATAFEILEHLVSPFPVLNQLSAARLFATVPLRLWFSSSFKNPNDPRDRHFHEFEPWQFEWLLDKAGWNIVRSEKWIPPLTQIGIRPLLRIITPRYYAIEAIRKTMPAS